MKEHEQKIKTLIENDLCIRRVPKKDLEWFKEYAKEEYSSDYGMLLKELIMFYKGMYIETTLAGLNTVDLKLDKVLDILEPHPEKEVPKPSRTMSEKINKMKQDRLNAKRSDLTEQKEKGE